MTLDAKAIDKLTPQEKAALRCVWAGLPAKETSVKIGCAERTVEKHLEKARWKLGARKSFVAARMLAEHESQS